MRTGRILSVLGCFLSTGLSQGSSRESFGTSLVAVCFDDRDAWVTQKQADDWCAEKFGTGLAKISSRDRWLEAKEVMSGTGNCTWDTWIGLEYDRESEKWEWLEGGNADSFSRWDEGFPSEPTNESDADCVQMMRPVWYRWQNTGCEERKRQLICESSASRWASSQYHTAVKIRTAMNWTQARHFCQNYFGTDLASWHSETEMTALRSTLESSSIWSDTGTYLYWGLNLLNQRNWTNADRSRTDYLRWWPGQPNINNNQQCSAMWLNPSDIYDNNMRHAMYSCQYGNLVSLVCNNENLEWTAGQTSIIVEAPNTEGRVYLDTDFRSSLQNSWTATQARSYCNSRFGESLVYLASNQSVEHLTDQVLRALAKSTGEPRELNSSTSLPLWTDLRFSVSKDRFEWQINETVLSKELSSDEWWIGGWQWTLDQARQGQMICVFLDVNDQSDTLGMFGLASCNDAFELFACNSEAYSYAASLEGYSLIEYNSKRKFHSRRHYYWVWAMDSSTQTRTNMNWRQANALCRLRYGTSLGSVHCGSADRIVNRASGNADYSSTNGWIGLRQVYSKQWEWASGTPMSGYDNFIYYNAYAGQDYCATDSTSEYTDTYGWSSQSCSSTTADFLCSTVRESWSKRQLSENQSRSLHAEYQRDIDQSSNGLVIPPSELLPRYALIQPTTGFKIHHRKYQQWCQKRYNRDAAAVKSEEQFQELQQLLIDENLLYSSEQGSGVIVLIGAEYNAQIGEWRWYDGSKVRWSMLQKAGVVVDEDRLNDKSKECLAIDTQTNEWISVGCKKVRASAWICKTPRKNRFNNVFRGPLRGTFCVAPWLYALLSVPIIVLNVFVHWWILRLIQFESYLDCQSEDELASIFEIPIWNQAKKSIGIGSKYEEQKSATQNELFFREQVNEMLMHSHDIPIEVCGLIHDFTGKPTIYAYVQTQYNRWKWLIRPLRTIWIPGQMILKMIVGLFNFALLLTIYSIWAENRTASWIQYGGFWITLAYHPTALKFAASNTVITKVNEIYESSIAKFEIRKSICDGNTMYEILWISLLVIEIILFSLAASLYGITAVVGAVLFPWAGLLATGVVWLVIARADDPDCDCNDISSLVKEWEVQTDQVRRVDPKSLQKSLLRLSNVVFWICLCWLFCVTSGISFWVFAIGKPYTDSIVYAWDNPFCDSYFDFDPFDWKAWMLLLHWLFI